MEMRITHCCFLPQNTLADAIRHLPDLFLASHSVCKFPFLRKGLYCRIHGQNIWLSSSSISSFYIIYPGRVLKNVNICTLFAWVYCRYSLVVDSSYICVHKRKDHYLMCRTQKYRTSKVILNPSLFLQTEQHTI